MDDSGDGKGFDGVGGRGGLTSSGLALARDRSTGSASSPTRDGEDRAKRFRPSGEEKDAATTDAEAGSSAFVRHVGGGGGGGAPDGAGSAAAGGAERGDVADEDEVDVYETVKLPDGGKEVSDDELKQLHKLMWGDERVAEDIARWHNQGLEFSDAPGVRFGLRQKSGGPCGVLCAINCLVLKQLLFGDSPSPGLGGREQNAELARVEDVGDADRIRALAVSISRVLGQARRNDRDYVTDARVVLCERVPFTVRTPASSFQVYTFSGDDKVRDFVEANMLQFSSSSGIMLLVFSMILTRSIESIKADTDDSSIPLVGRFGHCSQELLNLFVYGSGVSNVFDGTKSMGGMELRGFTHTPLIGYLSILESMRYMEVGTFCKDPQWPMWVVGSQSHYTVCFATDTRANESSPDAAARRAFNLFDQDNNSFIEASNVRHVLEALELPIVENEGKLTALCNTLDTGGIVLWNDFWTAVGPMLRKQDDSDAAGPSVSEEEKSDLELAMKLQAEFDAEAGGGAAPVAAAAAPPADSAPIDLTGSNVTGGVRDDVVRSVNLYHYNGLEDGGRKPTLSKLTITQRDSGFFDVTSTDGDNPPAIEGVLRTKWTGATVAYQTGAPEPKLD